MPKLCAEAGFLLSSTPGLREEVHGLGSFFEKVAIDSRLCPM